MSDIDPLQLEEAKRVREREIHEAVRLLEKQFAGIFGYFWLPCPLCGEEFSGREVTEYSSLYHIPTDTPGTYEMICPKCGEEKHKEATGIA